MRRIAVTLVVASVFGVTSYGQSEVGPGLDVVGLRIGMTVKEVAAALKTHNPRLMLAPTTRTLEGFAQPLLFSIIGEEAVTAGPDATIARAGEIVELLFTTPPSTEVVWGVRRTYNFATREMPGMQITLDALQKKYGPPTVPASPDPRGGTKTLAWVYDAEGKPMGPSGAPLNTMCAGLVTAHFGSGDQRTMNQIQTGQPSPAQCQSISIVNATVLAGGLDAANPQLVVYTLIVQITDDRRHRASVDATRAVALAAAKARESQKDKEVEKRAAPKL